MSDDDDDDDLGLTDADWVAPSGEVEDVKLSDLVPATANDRLYKPVVPSDPGVKALADLIRRQGLLEPIVVTLDNVILSGHRRRVACQVAGLVTVPVRYVGIYSTHPRFLEYLASFNEQRVKSVDEQLRESVVTSAPADAHRALVAHRAKKAAGVAKGVNAIVLGDAKKRKQISAAKQPMLQAAQAVIARLQPFWPLTVRQIHYQLLNAPPLRHAAKKGSRYKNNRESYSDLCDLLTRARLAGDVAWHIITDETRPVVTWNVHPDPRPFIRAGVTGFLTGYFRNLVQSQPAHVEIVAEKLTLKGIIRPVAAEYCLPLVIGRGYSSIVPRYNLVQRFRRTGKDRLIVLCLSDFDPEGESIAESFARSLRDDFGVDDVTGIKVAINAEHVREFGLPPKLEVKTGSSRAGGFVEKHGKNVWELEALEPTVLQRLLREAIESVLDMDLFRHEQERETIDAVEIDTARKRVGLALGVGAAGADDGEEDDGDSDLDDGDE